MNFWIVCTFKIWCFGLPWQRHASPTHQHQGVERQKPCLHTPHSRNHDLVEKILLGFWNGGEDNTGIMIWWRKYYRDHGMVKTILQGSWYGDQNIILGSWSGVDNSGIMIRYGNFAGWEDFATWRSCIGKCLCSTGLSSLVVSSVCHHYFSDEPSSNALKGGKKGGKNTTGIMIWWRRWYCHYSKILPVTLSSCFSCSLKAALTAGPDWLSSLQFISMQSSAVQWSAVQVGLVRRTIPLECHLATNFSHYTSYCVYKNTLADPYHFTSDHALSLFCYKRDYNGKQGQGNQCQTLWVKF